jgi:hypothetical protein
VNHSVVVIAAMLVLASCAGPPGTGALLSQTAIHGETFNIDYQTLANCTHARLDHIYGVGLRKSDLPTYSTIRIAMEPAYVRYWELSFISQDKNRTRVELTAAQTMIGAPVPADVFQRVKACAP